MEGAKQSDVASDLGMPPQSTAFQHAASQALYNSLPPPSQSMFSHSPVPGQALQQAALDVPYENMAAQGLPESAHSYYESLSSQAQHQPVQQQPVSQSMYSLQHVQQQQQQQLMAPFEAMTLQSTSSQGQEVFDSLTGHVQGPFSAQGMAGQPVQQGILEGIARQQRVASYNNLLAQAQAQAHAQVQAQVDHEQRLLDEYAVGNAQRVHAAAELMNSLNAAPQQLNLAMDSASAQHNAALLASLHDVAQHRGTPGLDGGSQHAVLPNGLQPRNSIGLESLASQHSGQGSMLAGLPHPVPVRMPSGVSANGSMAALSELSEQQEPSLVNQEPLLDAARAAGFMKPPSLPQHLGPADVCSPPFSPPKNAVLTAQRSGEAPGLSLSKSHTPESDGGVISSATAEKLRREIARLSQETERLDKEVARQKALREGERVEFAEAKERLKASWAVDRDDFARVKEQLKKKNAEHHVQNGRLSQSLKEAEASCRMLRELCLRSGVLVPPELMQSSSSLANSTSLQSALSTEVPAATSKAADATMDTSATTAPLPPLPPSAHQMAVPVPPAPFAASQESSPAPAVPAIVTGTPVPAVAAVAPPASTAAAATAMATAVMQQLESVTSAVSSTAETAAPVERTERPTEQNVTAATAAANAAAALGQLAAALAGQAPPELPAAVVALPVQPAPAVQPEPAAVDAKPAVVPSINAGSGEGASVPSTSASSKQSAKE